jgi:DNA-binding Lrp family transcriptional regulator
LLQRIYESIEVVARGGRSAPDAVGRGTVFDPTALTRTRIRDAPAWRSRLLPSAAVFAGLPPAAASHTEARMVPFFVQIKCHLGQSYEVANKLADAELASEIYSTAGDFDLLVKFYVEDKTDIGHFVNEKVQTIPGIQDTRTIITFKAF